jgi:hypothetical protein
VGGGEEEKEEGIWKGNGKSAGDFISRALVVAVF